MAPFKVNQPFKFLNLMSKITELPNKEETQVLPREQFPGNYTIQGSNYFQNQSNNLLIKVCTRLQETQLKPKFYLMNRTPDGKFVFLSSLYPTGILTNTYKVEIQRKYFTVIYTGSTFNVIAL